jgi:hypothetical protein
MIASDTIIIQACNITLWGKQTMSKSSLLKSLDQEDSELYSELTTMATKDILRGVKDPNFLFDPWKYVGFRVAGSKVMIPQNVCGIPIISPYSLLPMYDCLFIPVSPIAEFLSETGKRKTFMKEKIVNEKLFKITHGLNPQEMAYLAEKGRAVPYFKASYEEYDERTIKPLLEPGVPRLSDGVKLALETAVGNLIMIRNQERREEYLTRAKNDLREIFGAPLNPESEIARKNIAGCGYCLASLYADGLHRVFEECGIRNRKYICVMSSIRFAQELGAVLHTDCKWTKGIIASWSGLPKGSSYEEIVEGLKLTYRHDIPLEVYLDILDSKTTAAVRRLIQRILEDPLAGKYSERLSARIYDYNQQIEDLSRSKTAKLFSIVSDIVVYGGSSFIESQSQKIVRIPKKGLQRIAEWMASKGMDLHAKITRRDWAVAQLCKARCKIEKCQTKSE